MPSISADRSSRVDGDPDGHRRGLRARWAGPLLAGVLGLIVAAMGSSVSAFSPPVTTRSYDNARTGWNQNEPVLTPSTVTPSTFHKVGELRVDDKIEASPLYVPGINTPSGPRDLLIVATTNNGFVANFAQEVMKGQLPWSVEGLRGQGIALCSRSEARCSSLNQHLSFLPSCACVRYRPVCLGLPRTLCTPTSAV